ncbi:MAG: HAD-IIA family hydrolase [Treponema sp.]|nr:HAD-IIA family hydrolase [Treponema sp.]
MYDLKEVEEWNKGIDKAALIDSCRHFVLDMDGTFYISETIYDGSLDFLAKLKETGRDFCFFTNNSSKNGDMYIEKLAKMNCFIDRKQIMTSGDVTIEYLNDKYPGKRVYLVGTPALVSDFEAGGINLVQEDAEVVVIGFDTTLTYEKIKKTCDFIRAGAVYLATHPDFNCPIKDGFLPDVGSFCDMFAASTGGYRPKVLGKPNPETVDMVIRRMGWKREEIAFVGDRLYTDVATGVNNGAHGLLVLCGEADMNTVRESKVRADAIFTGLPEIGSYLR